MARGAEARAAMVAGADLRLAEARVPQRYIFCLKLAFRFEWQSQDGQEQP
jgi:hypothetical protein